MVWVFLILLVLASSSVGVDPVVHRQMVRVPAPRTFKEETSRADLAQLHLLDDVLLSKNDNDPRLDRELASLSDGARELFRERYRSLSFESRNERGTIVFLLGKNLKNPRDFEFFETVFREGPCLSLDDCEREAVGGEEESSLAVSLAYPQLVALSSVERELASASDRSDQLRELVETAARSPVPMVAEKAQRLLERL
jgi:hypothetical protein